MCHFKQLLFCLVVVLFITSCNEVIEKDTTELIDNKKNTTIKYAKGFEIKYYQNYKIITLKNAWKGNENHYQYVLYEKEKPKGNENAIFIKTPIQKIACTSLTHIAFLEKLNQLNSIAALNGCQLTSSKNVVELIDKGKIKEIGQYPSINYELLVNESPDIIMAFGIDNASYKSIDKLEELGLIVVLNSEYMELHPLGKAEWIKFIAAFYGLDEEASEIFDGIEKEYLMLTELTKKVKQKPSVFVGIPWKGAWHVPGGKSFMAQFFNDARANYLWTDNNESGGLVKDKEVILEEALESSFWLDQGNCKNVDQIIEYDEKFKNFNAFKEGNLFNNNKRLNANGGNDYWESGVANPHIILKDLIEIFHPDLLEHEFYYYQKLE